MGAKKLRLFEMVMDNMESSVIITDTEGEIVYVNKAFEKHTGFLAQEALGKNPRILKSGVHGPEFYYTMWRTLNAGHTWRGRICNRKKNGDLFWETAVISPVKNGEVTHYFAIKYNISQEVFLEQKAELSDTKLRRIIDSVDIGYIEWGTDRKVREWNPAAEEIFGWTKEEAVGNRGLLITPDEIRSDIMELFTSITQSEESIRARTKNITKDGRLIFCEWVSTPFKLDGEIHGVISLVQDVTYQQQETQLLMDAIKSVSVTIPQ